MTATAEPFPTTEATSAPPKVDPESLVLRGKPPRAIRFKRSVIIAMTTATTVALVATAWIALRPVSFHLAAQPYDKSEPANSPTDTLNALPSNYGDVPKLGPPLPGDLGRPILERQREMATETGPDVASAGRSYPQAEATVRSQRVASLKAARESGLIVKSAQSTSELGAGAQSPDIPVPPGDAPKAALDPERDPNAQQHKIDFVRNADGGGDTNSHALAPPASPYILSAGSVIAASLITGLRSDLPGLVTAQVTERVYDSPTGRTLLIPQGARLIGSYDSVVAFGQKRALVVWQRIILPDGNSLALENVPATDPSGYVGLADKVDFHTWKLLQGVTMSTLLGVGANLTFTGQSDLVQAIRESTQQNVSRAGDQITSRNLQVQPTITIRPGAPVRLVIHKDLILTPWKQ